MYTPRYQALVGYAWSLSICQAVHAGAEMDERGWFLCSAIGAKQISIVGTGCTKGFKCVSMDAMSRIGINPLVLLTLASK